MVSKVFIVGCGMGNPAMLTQAARDAIAESALLVGAPRLLESFGGTGAEEVPLVASEGIAEALRASEAPVASVLLSGDVGFYSGATGLYPLLEGFDVETIPGISSLVYFCAKLHTTWQDAHLVSAHGREHNAVGAIQTHAKTFLLTGGDAGCADICRDLAEHGLGGLRVHVGQRLSYDDEQIASGTAAELAERAFDSLAVMLVENPAPIRRAQQAPCLPDGVFERGAAPMTKEEVRELAICKLQIEPAHTVWDVGAGTGSISVEAALAACEGQVVAVERNEEALRLLRANKDRFGLSNVRIVPGAAPEALAGLPVPDCVFVGGSSGQLEAILRCAVDANPHVRLCISAITLETLSETLHCIQALDLHNADIVQLAFAKDKTIGGYHMMMGANPIYLVCATGPGAGEAGEASEQAAGGAL